jgi:chromosome partitioning protein
MDPSPLVFTTRVVEAVDYVEALNQRKPVAQYKPRSAAARAMRALAEELEWRLIHGVSQLEWRLIHGVSQEAV